MNFDQLFEPRLEAGLPVMPSGSHIVPVLVAIRSAARRHPKSCSCALASMSSRSTTDGPARDRAPAPHPDPLQSDEHINRLVTALTEIWSMAGKKVAECSRTSDRA
jgi:hypothetical protein